MLGRGTFPKFDKGTPIRAEDLNKIAREVKRLGQIKAAAPLSVASNATGIHIALTQSQEYCSLLVSGDSTTDVIDASGNLAIADKTTQLRTAGITIESGNSIKLNRAGVFSIDWPASVYCIYTGGSTINHWTYTISISMTTPSGTTGVASQESHTQYEQSPALKGDGFSQISTLVKLSGSDLPCVFNLVASIANSPLPDHWYLGGGDVVDSELRIMQIA